MDWGHCTTNSFRILGIKPYMKQFKMASGGKPRTRLPKGSVDGIRKLGLSVVWRKRVGVNLSEGLESRIFGVDIRLSSCKRRRWGGGSE